MTDAFVSGFVALIGRPNVGKSTLLNRLVGRKVAIMSDKAQTTRNRILGVLHRPAAQVVFLDTPGIHKPLHRLGAHLNQVSEGVIPGVDLVLFVVDGSTMPGEGDRYIVEKLKNSGKPVLLVVNKQDRIPQDGLYRVLDAYKALEADDDFDWLDIVPVSAVTGRHLQDLVEIICRHLPAGPKYFPAEMVTDQPEREIMRELIREQVLHLTREEVPHSVAVAVEEVAEREGGTLYVRAEVLVERQGQKGILVGKGGAMIKAIGQRGRAAIEELLGSPVYLDLYVKVKEDWRNRDSLLRQLGYTDQ